MIYPVYSIRDCVLNAYEPPFLALHDAAASRTFRNLLDDTGSPYFQNKADYSLWRVGEFDTSAGVLDCIAPVRLMSGFGDEKMDRTPVRLTAGPGGDKTDGKEV